MDKEIHTLLKKELKSTCNVFSMLILCQLHLFSMFSTVSYVNDDEIQVRIMLGTYMN